MKKPPFSALFTRFTVVVFALLATAAGAEQVDTNNPGFLEPVSTHLNELLGLPDPVVRVPNTDQSVDGVEQTAVHGELVFEDAAGAVSPLGHPITHIASPNFDMRVALQDMAVASAVGDEAAMGAAADELMAILLGTTEGRIYDGFSMLNFNRWTDARIGPEHFPPDIVRGEYKTKRVRDTGETYTSPFDGEVRRVWEVDIDKLYYDGQIDADTFLVHFPAEAHPDDTVRVNYRIFSLVREDFSPTVVTLDRRQAQDTVQFPYKGMDAVWIAFNPGQILNVSVDYPPIRMWRGVYTWGWRDHPPRIQFVQPIYDIVNQHTGETELDPQSKSFVERNRDEMRIDLIADQAPEKKMYTVAQAVIDGASTATIDGWLNRANEGPAGVWFEWADLAEFQTQLPPEAWERLAEEEGLAIGDFGDFNMVSVFMNNEMYGSGPFLNEIKDWDQGETFTVKLINFDKHTHYFRNVDFGARLNDDILRCCGGGETSFEVMNFKPSYGAPKVAEMQWRAGWGFRPHYDVIQQPDVFPRGIDRMKLTPYTSGDGGSYWGYQYSQEARGGDFRFNPPPFIITDHDHPAENPLRDVDGQAGLVLGQHTEGYGVAQACPGDPYPGFCQSDWSQYNPNAVFNWPEPANPDVPKTELRFPPFLRNPAQGEATAGDIIPPTGAWRPFLWINPNNGTLWIDPEDPSKGHWVDLTYSHGAPVFANSSIVSTVELPRASGQVFYQFDDLFHDNSIFSPHPVFAGFGELDSKDTLVGIKASQRGNTLRIKGKLSRFPDSNSGFAAFVSVFSGTEGENGCTGTFVGAAEVNVSNGRFVLRLANSGLAPGGDVCVQSSVGGFAGTVVQ